MIVVTTTNNNMNINIYSSNPTLLTNTQKTISTITSETVKILLIAQSQISSTTNYQESYETINKNLKSYNCSFNYSNNNVLQSIVYQKNDSSTITKTINYDNQGRLQSILLSGSLPTGIKLRKTFNYSAGNINRIIYSAS